MSNAELSNVVKRITAAGRRNRISRREFMVEATAAGMTIAAASSLWASNAAAETPKQGGTYRLGLHDGNTADQMDPGRYQSVGEIQLAHTHRSYLTEITADNGLGGDMADSWSATPDAKVWTFELNKDASFHDGRKFTAKDAIASLNHHRGEDTTSAAKPLLESVTDIRADGDHTIIIELNQGFADLPWVMTDYHLTMLPAMEDGTIEWETGIGAGPYRIEGHEPGVSTTVARHDGWHREGAYFDEVEITILNDPNARQTALVTGAVDAISSVDLKTLALLSRSRDVDVENVPSGSAITLPMFCDHPPYDNVDVRLALKHAIDREEIVEKILFGTGTPGNDFHVSPNMPYWPDIEQRKYDPDQAKFHLKQAGMDESQRGALGGRQRASGSGRHGGALQRAGKEGGHQYQAGSRTERQLLGGCLAEETVCLREVGRTSRLRTTCSPWPTRQMPHGTKRTGKTTASTNCCCLPRRNSTRR